MHLACAAGFLLVYTTFTCIYIHTMFHNPLFVARRVDLRFFLLVLILECDVLAVFITRDRDPATTV